MMEEKSLERIELEAEAGMLIKRLTEEQAQELLPEILELKTSNGIADI